LTPSSGAVFAVGVARALETLLLSPQDLRAAFNAKDFHGAVAVIKSRPFGRLLDEAKKDFGIGEYVLAYSKLFSEISESGGFFTGDTSEFLKFLEENSRNEILSAMKTYTSPLDFYEFLDGKRKDRRGKIEGEDVLEYIWMALWWQMMLVRMIFISKKQNADFKYVV